MAARRCPLHGSFPSNIFRCPVCNEETDYIPNGEPDDNWESNIARHKEWLEQAGTEPADIPLLPGARVRFDGDQYWIHTWDVVLGGVNHRLREGDLVQVGKQTFEILHYEYDLREYLVRPFSLELSDEDLALLADDGRSGA